MLVPALVLTVLPVVVTADGQSLATSVLASVPAVVALVFPIWFSLDLAHHDERATRIRRREEVLDPVGPESDTWPRPSVLSLLRAEASPSRLFFGRAQPIRELERWLGSSVPIVIVASNCQMLWMRRL